jgi:predicted transcriptional regulator
MSFGGAVMPKEAVFTMKLEPELRDEFMFEAEAAHRPASQVVRELMREFVQRQREAREYDAFLNQKVEQARASMRAGRGRSSEEVEVDFVARRAELLQKADKAGA